MLNKQLHPIIHDFVSWSVSLPEWFTDLGLETDCYEAPLPNSQPGSLTPPDVYAKLIQSFRQYYNKDKAVEIFCPRGPNFYWKNLPQVFTAYDSNVKLNFDKPIISVYPRGRSRAPHRNVPENVWLNIVEGLKTDFIVVLGGTPSGACLSGYRSDNVINLIDCNDKNKFEQVIDHCCNSVCTISSQSGLTHVSLLCRIPTYIIGHEKFRHTVELNRFKSPTSFRYVEDYRAIDADTVLRDVAEFLSLLKKSNYFDKRNEVNNPSIVPYDSVIMEDLNNIKRLIHERGTR